MFWKFLNATVAALWYYQSDAASGLVGPTGMMGTAPVLGRGTTGVSERIA